MKKVASNLRRVHGLHNLAGKARLVSNGQLAALRQAALIHQSNLYLIDTNRRLFFGGSKKEDDGAKPEEEAKHSEKEEVEEKNESNEKDQAEKGESSQSSDESDVELSAEDIKKIKQLIRDQDKTIEENEAKIEQLDKDLKEMKQKLVYQLAENDNTVKRYRKQIDDAKQFAI